MSLLIVGIDVTIVNVALPSIGHDFHASLSGLQWTVDAYTLVLASLLMVSGSTADRLGRRRTFVIGLCHVRRRLTAVQPGPQPRHARRLPHGAGGRRVDAEPGGHVDHHEHLHRFPGSGPRPSGSGAAVVGVSMALGPVVGGVLVTSVGWRSIFWINIPIALVAVVLALRYIPESKAAVARRVDVPGQMLVIVFLASLTYGIIESPAKGWSSTIIIGTFTVALVSLVSFLIWERRAAEPLIDLRFFRSVPFSSATVIAVAAFAALGGFLFLNTLYLQDVRGLSALQAGVDTLPMAAMTMLLSPISGRLVGRRGARIPLLVAGVGLTVSCLMLVGLSATTPFTWLFTAYVVFGIGFGFVNAPITNAAVSGMPRAQAGVAAAIASTSRQIGSTLGVAVVGIARLCVAAEGQPSRLRGGQPRRLVGPGRVRRRRAGPRAWWRRPRGPGSRRTARPRQSTPSTWRRTWHDEGRYGAVVTVRPAKRGGPWPIWSWTTSADAR